MLGNKVRLLREKLAISRKELASELDISYAALAKYETNEREPDLKTTKKFADYFGISLDELLDRITKIRTDSASLPRSTGRIPVFSQIVAGQVHPPATQIFDWEIVSDEFAKTDDYFYLIAQDNSMSGARIKKGDRVLIKKLNRVESGALALVAVGQEPAVLRRVILAGEVTILQPESPNYQINVISPDQSERQPVIILGVPVKVSFIL